MKKCIVIGGGLAGLTSAAYLADSGYNVEVLEASPKIGGRAYSFKDKQTGFIIDNGQHLLMGCYKETLRFFRLIGAEKNLTYQKRLKVIFLKENFQIFFFQAPLIPYPLNLLSALLKYNAVSFQERLVFIKFFLKLPFISPEKLADLSVYDWLVKENQNENIRKAFWEIFSVGTLNTSIYKASASSLAYILKEAFLSGNKASTILVPKFGLSETYSNDSVKFIEERGGKISTLEQVERINHRETKITKIKTSRREISDFDFVISSVPLFNLKKILPDMDLTGGLELSYSTIVSIHIWLKENLLPEKFYGLIGSPVHWIFNHNDHLTLVISDADYLNEVSKEEIFRMAAEQLEKFVLIKSGKILSYKIIKEKRATFVPSNKILDRRPNSRTQFSNFFLAGDWVNTGLPSTIESAVKSGKMAADLLKTSV